MKIKFTFNTPSNGYTAQLVIEVVCSQLPMIMPGTNWFNILPIDSYSVIEEESSKKYFEEFKIEGIYNNKSQLVVRPVKPQNIFFMSIPVVDEE